MTTRNELKRRIALEDRIARTIVTDALAAGFSLNINNGGDGSELPEPSQDRATIIKHMFLTGLIYMTP